MSSVRAVVVCAAFAIACGDASGTSSDHWGGINSGGGGDDDSNANTTDASTSSGADANASVDSGAQASIQVMTDQTSYTVELRATVAVQVTIAPKNFTGTINLAVSGLPTGVTGVFAPTSVSVSGNTGATSVLTLTTISSVVPATTPFEVTGTSGSTTASASPALGVLPQITIQIPMNVDSLEGTSGSPSTNAFGDYPIVLTAPSNLSTTNPLTVKFLNNDSAPHCIHASNPNQGFPHDLVTNGVCNNLMAKGTFDQTNHPVNTKGSYLFYLHDQGDLTDGMIKVQ